jgi:hypothetical protein
VANDELPGNREALDAIAAISAQPRSEVVDQFHAAVTGGETTAAPTEVEDALRSLINRVKLSPALDWEDKERHHKALTGLLDNPPELNRAHLGAWAHLTRHLPEAIPTLQRSPVALPHMAEPQEAAWHILMDLDAQQDEPWVLVGGQMTMIHCLENGIHAYRATDDGDVVLGVWTRRNALKTTSRFLQDRHFRPVDTSDGFGYRYAREDTIIDLLLPEGLDRQRQQPTTATGKRGLSVDGGNQALIRAERLPVQLGDRAGHIRRPNILGALIVKAAALRADSRNPDRHREDIALLGQVALQTGLRMLDVLATPHDRKRLRQALDDMPPEHGAWRQLPDPGATIEGLARLAEPRPAKRA